MGKLIKAQMSCDTNGCGYTVLFGMLFIGAAALVYGLINLPAGRQLRGSGVDEPNLDFIGKSENITEIEYQN